MPFPKAPDMQTLLAEVVPPDAVGFLSLRTAELDRTRSGRKLLQVLLGPEPVPGLRQLFRKRRGEIKGVTLVKVIPRAGSTVAVIFPTGPINPMQMREILPGAKTEDREGQALLAAGEKAVGFLNPFAYVFGSRAAVRRYLGRLSRAGKKGPLGPALAPGKSPHDLLAGFVPTPKNLRPWRQWLEETSADLAGLRDVKSAAVTGSVGAEARLVVRLGFANAAGAAKGKGAVAAGLKHLSKMVTQKIPAREMADGHNEDHSPASKVLEEGLQGGSVKVRGRVVTVTLRFGKGWAAAVAQLAGAGGEAEH
jgi:hypothetical protein